MDPIFFWITWGVVSFWAIKTFYYSFTKEKLERLRKSIIGINLAILILTFLPWLPTQFGGKTGLSLVLEGNTWAVIVVTLLVVSITFFLTKKALLLKIASAATIINTFLFFVLMYQLRPGTFVLTLYDIAPIIAVFLLLVGDVVSLLLWQQLQIQETNPKRDPSKEDEKEITKSSATILSNVRLWFGNKPLFQKVLIIVAGISLLFGLYIVSILVRYPGSSTISDGAKSISGNVIDQSGKSIEGAVIAVKNKISVAKSDGTFTISAVPEDTLSISAFGYETIQVPASRPSVTLSALPPATVRLVVVGPKNQALSKALVYRLNANSFVPVAIGLTNQSGEMLFENILSGQVAFVVLHPDYGFGWLETNLKPGEAIRSVVRLTPLQAEKKSASAGFKFIRPVLAQTPVNPAFELKRKVALEFAKTEKTGDNTYNIAQEVQTILAVGTDRESLLKYIKMLENDFESNRVPNNLIGEGLKKFEEIMERELSPMTIVRFREGPYQTHYLVERGWNSNGQATNIAWKTENRNIVFEIERKSADQSMAVLKAQHAVDSANNQPLIVTSWSKAEAAELAGVENVLFNQPQATVVCCSQSEVTPSSSGNTLPREVSSNEVPPSDLTLSDSNHKQAYLYYSHRTVNEMLGKPNLETVASGILEQNPTLSFVDKTSGSSFSFLEIPPPDPNDAPPAFLLDFFENASDARSAFLDRSITYKSKWKQFMATIGSEVFQKEGRTPYQVYWDLKKDIGTSQAWRVAEEKKLAQQASQQRSNSTSQQSAPPNSQGSEQTDSSDPQDDGAQLTPYPTLETEQDDQSNGNDQQQGNSSGSQGSSTGTNKSNSGSGKSGWAVQPR